MINRKVMFSAVAMLVALRGGAEARSRDGTVAIVAAAAPTAPVGARMALRGTIVQSDTRRSEAMVDFGGGDLARVRVGDSLRQYGRITGITTNSILIERNGREYEFTFNDSSFGNAGTLISGRQDDSAAAGDSDGSIPQSVRIRERRALGEQPPEVNPGPPDEIDATDWDVPTAARR